MSSMERFGALGAALALTGALAGCASSQEGAPDPEIAAIAMRAAQEGVVPISALEAMGITAEDISDLFVDGASCTFKETREKMQEFLKETADALRAQGLEDDEVMSELSDIMRTTTVEAFKKDPERAKNYLLGFDGTDREPVQRLQEMAGEWDLSDDTTTISTLESLLTRSSGVIVQEKVEGVENTMCLSPDGRVVPAGERTLNPGDIAWAYNATIVENEETGALEMVIADRNDPDKRYRTPVTEGLILLNIDGKLIPIWGVFVCGNQVGKNEVVPFVPATSSPSETTTTPPGEDNDKDDSKTSRRSRAVEEDGDVGETVEPGQEDEAEPGGQVAHTESDDTGHLDGNHPDGQETSNNDDEDSTNGTTSGDGTSTEGDGGTTAEGGGGGSSEDDAVVDDSTTTEDDDDKGDDAATRIGQVN